MSTSTSTAVSQFWHNVLCLLRSSLWPESALNRITFDDLYTLSCCARAWQKEIQSVSSLMFRVSTLQVLETTSKAQDIACTVVRPRENEQIWDEALRRGERAAAMDLHSPKFRKTILREENAEATRSELYRDIMSNLSQPLKKIPSKYLYDDAGSAIYAQITELKSYYLTAAEREILSVHASTIIDKHILPHPGPVSLVELGAGDGRKTCILLKALLNADVQFEYMPIDISDGAMTALFKSLEAIFSDTPLRVHGIVADYGQGIEHAVKLHPDQRTVVLFLGSSIGNFAPAEAKAFLTTIQSALHDRDLLLLGCDMKKNPALLQAAYDDPGRVTEKFNLNLLTRLNRELGADFDHSCFSHHAMYDPVLGCMKSFLLSKTAHHVRFSCRQRREKDNVFFFSKWEPIFTEYSFKYRIEEVHSMISEAGFIPVADYHDRHGWFLNTIAQVRKQEAT